jgi:hypothetical protein
MEDFGLQMARAPSSDFPRGVIVLLLHDRREAAGEDDVGHYVAVSNVDALLRDSKLRSARQ